MNKIDWVKKLTSRKFWLAVANFVTMLIVALGGTENEAAQVSALIIAGATVIAYIIGEGLNDASYNKTEIVTSGYIQTIEADDEKDDNK